MKLRIEQRVGEPVDVTLLRAFALALPQMSRRTAQAAAAWMLAKSNDVRTDFGRDQSGPECERALRKYLKRRMVGLRSSSTTNTPEGPKRG